MIQKFLSLNTRRNRSLTLAFFLSWLLWLLFWLPYYFGLLIHYYTDDDYGTTWLQKVQHIYLWNLPLQLNMFFALFKNSLYMFYSHLNVLIFIVVLKPFRSWLTLILLFPVRLVARGFTKKQLASKDPKNKTTRVDFSYALS